MPAIIVVDLGFGDAGKGSLVDYYVRQHHAHTVVRFNGGAQAAHNVVTPEGVHHCFAQFGSGTLVPGVRTHLSRFMLLDPLALLQEEQHLRELGVTDAFERLSVAQDAPVATPFQRAANRLREVARGRARHGSCGMGIGETMADQLADPAAIVYARDLGRPAVLRDKLRALQDHKRREFARTVLPDDPIVDRELALLADPAAAAEFAGLYVQIARRFAVVPASGEVLNTSGTIIFEGAQGVLLDEWHGFHPYTTWSTTTFANAVTLLREANYREPVTRIGAMRAYMTRHGPGPFPTEDAALAHALPDAHNGTNAWQRSFRVGWLDLVLLRYALDVAGGVDQLAVTCLDRLGAAPGLRVCRRYDGPLDGCAEQGRLRVMPPPNLEYQEKLTQALLGCAPRYESVGNETELLDAIEVELNCPIGLVSHGPAWRDKRAHRHTEAFLASAGVMATPPHAACSRRAPGATFAAPAR
jgi:adenylosuccinate synthase